MQRNLPVLLTCAGMGCGASGFGIFDFVNGAPIRVQGLRPGRKRPWQSSRLPRKGSVVAIQAWRVRSESGRALYFGVNLQMRYVYHLGAHKTGSTLIQKNLSANLQALRDQGIWYVNDEMPKAISKQRKILRQFRSPDLENPPADALAGVNRRIATRARRAGADTVLLSEENRLGPPMHQELLWGIKRPGFYPAAADCMKYVTFGQPHENMKIFLFSREPSSFALSLYSEAVRMGQTKLDIGSFFAEIDFASIDFDDLKTRLQTLGAGVSVSMSAFEEVRADAATLLTHAFRELGIDLANISFDLERTRTRLDRSQIADILELERRAGIRPVHRQKMRNEILERAPNAQDMAALPDWVQARLRQ